MLSAISNHPMTSFSSTWTRLPDLPDAEGLAGMYAGTHGSTLICAGGTNFPDKPMLEGGTKTWTDKIFTLAPDSAEWKVTTLPMPYGYGASATIEAGLLCLGGCDKNGHRKEVFLLNMNAGEVQITALPELPVALAYTAAAVLNGKVYLLGGCERPGEQDCTNRMFMLDSHATEHGWQEVDALPGRGRFLHQMATVNGHIYVLGGIGLIEKDGKMARELLTEAWMYHPEEGWTQLADLPYAVAAAPTPAPVSATGGIYLLGGDDGSGKKYTPQTNPGFNNQSLCFDTVAGIWHDGGSIGAPRAVLPCCEWQGAYVAVNGELKPGRRSNQVWSINVQ